MLRESILHHVIIRWIERKNIFRDTTGKQNLVNRLDQLIPQTQTSCYAWVLLSNYAHFLLRCGPDGLVSLMQRLLTGYAVSFNRRHKRHGHRKTPIFWNWCAIFILIRCAPAWSRILRR